MRKENRIYFFLFLLAGTTLACGWLLQWGAKEPSGQDELKATETALALTATALATQGSKFDLVPLLRGDGGAVLLSYSFDLLFRPKQAHLMRPAAPPAELSIVWDRATGDDVRPGHTIVPKGGDAYALNIYERPFNENQQNTYYPDLDIVQGKLAIDDAWVYVSIQLYGQRPGASVPQGNYGVELDLDRDGRGDLLVWVLGPVTDTDWVDTGVQVFFDSDNDVGSYRVCAPDAPYNGTGYDRMVFYESRGVDPDLAWVRWVSSGKPEVQIAFKKELLGGSNQFFWWVWADEGVNRPQFMNYHDGILFAAAGSPYPDHPFYPVRRVARLDNTCRAAYGFTPNAQDLACGVCPDGNRGEPARDDEKLCPQPEGPPDWPNAECSWEEEGQVWRCRYLRRMPIVDADAEAEEEQQVVQLVPQRPSPWFGLGGAPAFRAPQEDIDLAQPVDDQGYVEVLCAWDPVTCRWDCDDRCIPSKASLQEACDILSEDPRNPTGNVLFCYQDLLRRVDRYTWNSDLCQWSRECVIDEFKADATVREQKHEGARCYSEYMDTVYAQDVLRNLGFTLEVSPLPGTSSSRPVSVVTFCHYGDEDEDLFEMGEALTVCVWDAEICDMRCETREGMELGTTNCPNGLDLTPLEEICTGQLSQPIPSVGEGITVFCLIDDGDGVATSVTPDRRIIPDIGDTHIIYRWNEETCSWEEDECVWGPTCTREGCSDPPPEEGPAFCDGRTPLEDGYWLCISYDETGERLPPLVCNWHGCEWKCEYYYCPEPEYPPGPRCSPSEEDPTVWECFLPAPSGAVLGYVCEWNTQVCQWDCPEPYIYADGCSPPRTEEEEGYCDLRDNGRWWCPGRGMFDKCEWDEEECRWRCWNVCQVDTNGPDGCDQIYHQGGNTWTCISGDRNLTCTFDTYVCDWRCDLTCEAPSGPPPQCTYKARQIDPLRWECYDPQGSTVWRYDLLSCAWVEE